MPAPRGQNLISPEGPASGDEPRYPAPDSAQEQPQDPAPESAHEPVQGEAPEGVPGEAQGPVHGERQAPAEEAVPEQAQGPGGVGDVLVDSMIAGAVAGTRFGALAAGGMIALRAVTSGIPALGSISLCVEVGTDTGVSWELLGGHCGGRIRLNVEWLKPRRRWTEQDAPGPKGSPRSREGANEVATDRPELGAKFGIKVDPLGGGGCAVAELVSSAPAGVILSVVPTLIPAFSSGALYGAAIGLGVRVFRLLKRRIQQR